MFAIQGLDQRAPVVSMDSTFLSINLINELLASESATSKAAVSVTRHSTQNAENARQITFLQRTDIASRNETL